MSRRHFQALAAIVASYAIPNGAGSVGVEKLAHDLADFCASENGRFDRERFLTAALGTDGRGNHYPKQVDGRTVWACCESSIGPTCEHTSASPYPASPAQVGGVWHGN